MNYYPIKVDNKEVAHARQIYEARRIAQVIANQLNKIVTLCAKHIAGYCDETFKPEHNEVTTA